MLYRLMLAFIVPRSGRNLLYLNSIGICGSVLGLITRRMQIGLLICPMIYLYIG